MAISGGPQAPQGGSLRRGILGQGRQARDPGGQPPGPARRGCTPPTVFNNSPIRDTWAGRPPASPQDPGPRTGIWQPPRGPPRGPRDPPEGVYRAARPHRGPLGGPMGGYPQNGPNPVISWLFGVRNRPFWPSLGAAPGGLVEAQGDPGYALGGPKWLWGPAWGLAGRLPAGPGPARGRLGGSPPGAPCVHPRVASFPSPGWGPRPQPPPVLGTLGCRCRRGPGTSVPRWPPPWSGAPGPPARNGVVSSPLPGGASGDPPPGWLASRHASSLGAGRMRPLRDRPPWAGSLGSYDARAPRYPSVGGDPHTPSVRSFATPFGRDRPDGPSPAHLEGPPQLRCRHDDGPSRWVPPHTRPGLGPLETIRPVLPAGGRVCVPCGAGRGRIWGGPTAPPD